MQRKQAMNEIFVAMAAAILCIAISYVYCRVNDPRHLLSQYNTVSSDFPAQQAWCLYYAGFESMRHDKFWSYWTSPDSQNSEAGDIPQRGLLSKIMPQEGYYSSLNKTVIRKHIHLLSEAGIDAIIVPWYNRHSDPHVFNKRRGTDKGLSRVISVADGSNVKVGIMIPDYFGRTWNSILVDIKGFNTMYGSRSCILKTERRPVIFIENAHKLKDSMYQLLRTRRTHLDCFFVAQTNAEDDFIAASRDGYDAVTTFHADENLTWGANTENWGKLKDSLDERATTMIPAVSPGTLTTSRDAGRYYGIRWEKAINLKSKIVFINSFNGWHEGTNIEPAVSTSEQKLDDDNWSGENSEAFMQITSKWTKKLKSA